MPTARESLALCVLNGKIYAIGKKGNYYIIAKYLGFINNHLRFDFLNNNNKEELVKDVSFDPKCFDFVKAKKMSMSFYIAPGRSEISGANSLGFAYRF